MLSLIANYSSKQFVNMFPTSGTQTSHYCLNVAGRLAGLANIGKLIATFFGKLISFLQICHKHFDCHEKTPQQNIKSSSPNKTICSVYRIIVNWC